MKTLLITSLLTVTLNVTAQEISTECKTSLSNLKDKTVYLWMASNSCWNDVKGGMKESVSRNCKAIRATQSPKIAGCTDVEINTEQGQSDMGIVMTNIQAIANNMKKVNTFK